MLILDAESLDRSIGASTDNSSKTFLGATQDAWLLNKLQNEQVTLNILICSKAWIATTVTPPYDLSDQDKVWVYGVWRDTLANTIATWNANIPLGKKRINILLIGGDRHKIGYVPGSGNLWGGFPCYVGSGWSAHHLDARTGEIGAPNGYHPVYEGHKVSGQPWLTMQYIRGTIRDMGLGGVDVTGELRYLVPAANPRYMWAMGRWGQVQTDHFNAI